MWSAVAVVGTATASPLPAAAAGVVVIAAAAAAAAILAAAAVVFVAGTFLHANILHGI